MKTIIKPIIILSIIIVGIVSLLTNCRKDTDCIAVITVRKYIDTNIVVPNARVVLHQANVTEQGVTDMNGQFKYTFKLPAILKVNATLSKKDTATADSLTGSAVIQLVVGGTASKSVLVE